MSYVDCCGWSECNQCGTCLIKCPVMRMKKDEARAAPHASCHAAWSACSLALRSNCSRNNLREPKQRDGTVAARSRSIPALQLNKRFKRRFFWWATKLERALAMASSAFAICLPPVARFNSRR